MTLTLVIGDLHLTDRAEDNYRWDTVRQAAALVKKRKINQVFLLGDLADRKDRHSGAFTNRVVDVLLSLTNLGGAQVFIMMGNHDKPVSGEPFWSWMSLVPNLTFITSRVYRNRAALYGNCSDPSLWEEPNTQIDAIFMHQTIGSPVAENGVVLDDGQALPAWAAGLPVYAGDVHVPQKCGNITYIGAPHPIKFGDSYDTNFYVFGNDWGAYEKVPVDTIRKHSLVIRSYEDLAAAEVSGGDQVKITIDVSAADPLIWTAINVRAAEWAQQRGVLLSSVNIQLTGANSEKVVQSAGEYSHAESLRKFCAEEGLGQDFQDFALALFEEEKG